MAKAMNETTDIKLAHNTKKNHKIIYLANTAGSYKTKI